MLNFVDEGSDHTVGHVGWHGLAADGAVDHMNLARSADEMSGGAAGNWEVSRKAETHRAL